MRSVFSVPGSILWISVSKDLAMLRTERYKTVDVSNILIESIATNRGGGGNHIPVAEIQYDANVNLLQL